MVDIQNLDSGPVWSQVLLKINPQINLLVTHAYTCIPLISIFLLGIFILYLIKYLAALNLTLQQKMIFLELTPPAVTGKSAYTTQQLVSVLHNIGTQTGFVDRMLGRKNMVSFEIVSTKEKGIRYLVRSDKEQAQVIERMVVAYLPQARIKRVEEYLPEKNKNSKITELVLKKHYAFPLAKQNLLNQHDPVAYITGMMTKLLPEEIIALQLVVSPTKKHETANISRRILRNEEILQHLHVFQFPKYIHPLVFVFSMLVKIIRVIGDEFIWAITELANGSSNKQNAQYNKIEQQNLLITNKLKPARVLSSFEQDAVTDIQEKINQSLFETSLRIFVSVSDKQKQKERIRGIKSSFAPFSVPMYQSFYSPYTLPIRLIQKIQLFTFKKRLFSPLRNKSNMLLSVSEIADIFHFPNTQITKTENIVKTHSKELPAPLTLKNQQKLDVIFAENIYAGTKTPIGLTIEERMRHIYIIGATGTGKTTLLLSMVNQDLNNNKGVCVIDPHGDLAEEVLNFIPEDRTHDVIYFNPQDIKYPIGINLLEQTPGLDADEALIEKEFIAESIISLFRKIFSDAWEAHPHRIEYILRNTIYTAFTLENPTLFTIFELLNNPPFQKKAIQGLQDEHLKNFWKYEFGRAGDYQKVKMVAPVTARIGRFLFSPSAKRILEQEKSTINFDEIIEKRKILICNLSKGTIGEDTSEVMGIMLLNKIQLAILKRAKIKKKDRVPFHLYVDEFQNFATPSFVHMLSESRKYGLSLTMAEQSTSQQKDKNLVQIILANTGTVIAFRSANPKDEELLLPQFKPYIEPGEIANLPSFHFYIKASAITPEEPFSGITIPVELEEEKEKIQKFILSSRINYATKYASNKNIIKKPEEKEGNDDTQKILVKNGFPA